MMFKEGAGSERLRLSPDTSGTQIKMAHVECAPFREALTSNLRRSFDANIELDLGLLLTVTIVGPSIGPTGGPCPASAGVRDGASRDGVLPSQ